MHTPAARARVVVVASSVSDATQICDLIRVDHPDVSPCLAAPDMAEVLATLEPAVLVLALRTLRLSQLVLEQLHGGGASALRETRQVLLLCQNEDLRGAFELCRDGSADDYVPFWPMAHDGLRLRMSVLRAVRLQLRLARREDADPRLAALAAEFGPPMQNGQTTDTAAGPGRPPVERGSADLLSPGQRTLDPLRSFVAELAQQAPRQPLPEGGGAQGIARPPARARPQLLVVDDDAFQIKLVRTMVAKLPLELVWVPSGGDALAYMLKQQPDMVLMDIDMPGGLDGIATVRLMRQKPSLTVVPVVMLTGHSDKARVVQSLQAGANGFIVKPFGKLVLLEILAKHLPDFDIPLTD